MFKDKTLRTVLFGKNTRIEYPKNKIQVFKYTDSSNERKEIRYRGDDGFVLYLIARIEKLEQKIPAQKLEWGATCNKDLKWEKAKKWCEEQGDGWRLPTRLELLQAYEDKIDGFESGYYWSSNEYSATNAWYQNFSAGYQYDGDKASTFYVRCVRDW